MRTHLPVELLSFWFENGPLRAATLDALPDPVFVCTPEGNIVYWNRRAREVSGYLDEEYRSMNVVDAVPAALEPVVREKLDEILEIGSARIEVPVRTQRRETTPFEVTGSLIEQDRKQLICGVARDISERKAQEKELRQREEQFRLLVKAVKEYAIFMLDPDGHIVTWNAGAERIKGYARHEILGEHFSVLYPDEQVEAGTPEKALKIASREGQWVDEGWRMRQDGSRFWGRVTITAVHNEAGVLRGYTKVTRDMTERRKRQEALRESERRYRRLFEESRDAVVLTTPDGDIVDVNSAAEEIFGYSREALLNLEARELYAQPDERGHRVLPALQETNSSLILEARMRHKDGHTFWASASVTVHRDEDGDPELIQALVRDITERRQLQQEVLHMQEEERRRIGQDLHDGVASQLTGIGLKLTNTIRRLDDDPSVVDRLQEIKELIDESCEDVRRLSHGLNPVHLANEDLPSALWKFAGNTERCYLEQDEDLPSLREDVETQLYWIAREATTNARKYADAERIRIGLKQNENNLVLTVEDDGTGFNPSALTDSGLGLRTMKYRAELIGGTVTIDTAPGEGTRVVCRLPMSSVGKSV